MKISNPSPIQTEIIEKILEIFELILKVKIFYLIS